MSKTKWRDVCALALVSTIAVLATPPPAHADDTRDSQWYLGTLDMSKVHGLSQGAGITIGVVDSGINPNQADIKGSVLPGATLDADGIVTGDGLADKIGHGTAIATTLVGHGHGSGDAKGILGIAPQASVMPVAIEWDTLSDDDRIDVIQDAITWLTSQDVDVIVVPLGVVDYGSHNKVIQDASKKDIVVFAPAGNEYERYGQWGIAGKSGSFWPADSDHAVPVTGLSPDGSAWKGSTDLSEIYTQTTLGISAPAVDIPIALPGGTYDTTSSTSFAAAIAAGELALVKSAYPDLDYWGLIYRSSLTVDDKSDEGYDDTYGWGTINPYRALTEDVEYEDELTSFKSDAADILPLDEQGKSEEPVETAGALLTPVPSRIPLWLEIGLPAFVVATTAITTPMFWLYRRQTHKQPSSQRV